MKGFSNSNGKTQSIVFALSILIIGLFCHGFWNIQASQPIETEDGVFNYSIDFVPSGFDEVSYVESTSAMGRYFQKKMADIMGYIFMDWQTIEFLNARKAELDYNISGFKLIENPMQQRDWSVKENRKEFINAMNPIIRELHPEVDQILWFDDFILQRSVDGDNPPAINQIHLDYHIDQSKTIAWNGDDFINNLDMILGVWMPDNMNTSVVDYPLAFMDGTTLNNEDVIPFFGEVQQKTKEEATYRVKFGSSMLKHNSKQRWYYYPNQAPDEVLIFRQYTNENTLGTFANAHTSIKIPDFPASAPSRRSVEMRVGLTLKKPELEAKTGKNLQELYMELRDTYLNPSS